MAMKLTVEFEYNEENGLKTLKHVYGGDYSEKERQKLLMQIIDTYLPTGPFEIVTQQLGLVWDDYKIQHQEIFGSSMEIQFNGR